MASFNRVILVGNLTRDVEIRRIPSGTAVTEISLAVNERVKRNEQWVDEVNYFDVTLWGRTAEIAGEYLSKGSSVLIEGRLKLDRWEQEDGQKRSKIKIIGDRMQMLGSKAGTSGGPNQSFGSSAEPNSDSEDDHVGSAAFRQNAPPADEVPF